MQQEPQALRHIFTMNVLAAEMEGESAQWLVRAPAGLHITALSSAFQPHLMSIVVRIGHA
jgi:hypothetical protein